MTIKLKPVTRMEVLDENNNGIGEIQFFPEINLWRFDTSSLHFYVEGENKEIALENIEKVLFPSVPQKEEEKLSWQYDSDNLIDKLSEKLGFEICMLHNRELYTMDLSHRNKLANSLTQYLTSYWGETFNIFVSLPELVNCENGRGKFYRIHFAKFRDSDLSGKAYYGRIDLYSDRYIVIDSDLQREFPDKTIDDDDNGTILFSTISNAKDYLNRQIRRNS